MITPADEDKVLASAKDVILHVVDQIGTPIARPIALDDIYTAFTVTSIAQLLFNLYGRPMVMLPVECDIFEHRSRDTYLPYFIIPEANETPQPEETTEDTESP